MPEVFLTFSFVEFDSAGLLFEDESIVGLKSLLDTSKTDNFLLIELLHFIGLL